jgi:phosphoglycolate phosphatase
MYENGGWIMSKRAVIFDLDGTLLDTLDDLTDAVNHILNKYGYPERSRGEVRSFLGNGARDLIKRSLPEGIDDELFEKYLAEYKEYYNAHSAVKTKPYDGVPALLESLKDKGILTAVVSNKPDDAVKELCRRYFGELVNISVGDRADLKRKPDAEPVRFAMDALGCESAVFVGDSEVDVMTAENADLPCVIMTWGFRDKGFLEEYGAKLFADDAEQLEKTIYELLAAEV